MEKNITNKNWRSEKRNDDQDQDMKKKIQQ